MPFAKCAVERFVLLAVLFAFCRSSIGNAQASIPFDFNQFLLSLGRTCAPLGDPDPVRANQALMIYEKLQTEGKHCAAYRLAHQMAEQVSVRSADEAWHLRAITSLLDQRDYAAAGGLGLSLLRERPALARNEAFRLKILESVEHAVYTIGLERDPTFLYFTLGIDPTTMAENRALALRSFVVDFPQSPNRVEIERKVHELWIFYLENELRIADWLDRRREHRAVIARLNGLYPNRNLHDLPRLIQVPYRIARAQLKVAEEITEPESIFDRYPRWPQQRLEALFQIPPGQFADRHAIAAGLLRQAKAAYADLRTQPEASSVDLASLFQQIQSTERTLRARALN